MVERTGQHGFSGRKRVRRVGPPWWGWLSLVFSGILAILFIVGGFFETRRFLRKMKADQAAVSKAAAPGSNPVNARQGEPDVQGK